MGLVDSHCHLDWNSFDGEREAVMDRAAEAGVNLVINPGVDLERSRRAVQLAERFKAVYAAVGIHPNDSVLWDKAVETEIRELAAKPKVIAIGEIGLDYYWDKAPRDLQHEVLRRQLELAAELTLPVIIHNREAGEDVLAILLEWQASLEADGSPLAERPGVLHSFSGNRAMAEAAIQQHFYIGITGPVTFEKKAEELQTLAAELPLEHILIETDSPFLSPEPKRGKRNEPGYVRFVAEKIAALRGISMHQVAAATSANVEWLFAMGVPA